MVLTEGFLLGIASGGTCLAYCAPVLVPYLPGEGHTVRNGAISVGGFLGGRFVGDLGFAVLAGWTHFAIVDRLPHQRIVVGIVTITLALLLLVYGFAGRPRSCRAAAMERRLGNLGRQDPVFMPALLGLATGLNVCPPFLMAFENAAQLPGLWQSLLFFAAFFVGTSLYVAPLPLIGQRSHGFVQIQWQPQDADLPDQIEEQIDFDADKTNDFQIQIDTKTNTASLKPSDARVLSVGEFLTIGNTRLARINLKR